MTLPQIKKTLANYSNKKKAKILQSFFKTGSGEYAEGDIFIGVTVPQIRKLAKEYQNISLVVLKKLIKSPIHEERLLALIILVLKFQEATTGKKAEIYRLYLQNTSYVNNWDLVDLTAANIVGAYLWDKNRSILFKLAKSKNLWERRIAIVSTAYFIKNNQFKDTLKVAKMLLCDKEDLIHKATGWMLREVGKRDQSLEERFLSKYQLKMPRITVRYAIERFPEARRQAYLKLKKS
ncbi:MAG: DNA alkylation repair protein [Candidatus Omnitrophica bacterium]|nr:DNA alkylation repair protein [Candidatus Omnitrophota bacterium]